MERTNTHKYNTIPSTKRVNHVTNFKNAPKMFQEDATENIKLTQEQTTLIAQTPKKKKSQLNQWKTTSTVKLQVNIGIQTPSQDV